MRGLAGREAEGQAVRDLLTAAASAPAALTVDGEPGIGKTTLFREAVRLAHLADWRILECRPTSAESLLSFAGLTDLLSSVDDETLELLPTPQQVAVSAAVLRASPAPVAPDERAIGTGLATLLTQSADSSPVLVAIDDAQWLDQPTTAAVTFALRRISSIRLGLLVCSRSGTTSARELVESLPDPAWSRALTLRGLGDSDLFHVVRERLGVSLSRPQLARVGDASAGNPYVAVELARALITSDDSTATELPVPQTLQSLGAERLVSLSPAEREAVLAVACTARPTLSLLAMLGLQEQLEEAERRDVVEVADGRIKFTHPLLAAAALDLASPPTLRSMHARLATVVTEPESIARHRALAVPEPNDDVAAALDAAVDSAVARGAAIAALNLAKLALERTVDPAGAAGWERRVRLAERLHVSGSTAQAGRLLEGLAEGCPAGSVRARGWLLLTEVTYQTSTSEQAARCAHAAIADAVDDPALRARALLSLVVISHGSDDGTRFVAAARRCVEESAVHDPELLAWVACEEVSMQFHRGEGLDQAALDGALVLERSGREWQSTDQVAQVRPALLKWADRYPDAHSALEELRERAGEEGNDGLLPYVSGHIVGVLLRMGRTQQAAAAAAQHLDDAEAAGQENQRIQALYNIALVDAHLGRLDASWKAADEVASWADREHDAWLQMAAAGLFGFIALSRDDLPTSRNWFDRWAGHCEALGLVDPGISRHDGDYIEVLLGVGALDEAAARTEDLQDRAGRADRVSASAVAERCRGLLVSTAGDQGGAVPHLEEALRLHGLCFVPFDQARTLLIIGVIHRRAKRKREAGVFLTQAADAFASLGAPGWVERTQAELRRVASRAAPLQLTPTEQRVAELAASGLTNRQVAEQAFISAKTVEANLARAYRKLGISSRAELGARMASANSEPLSVSLPSPKG